MEKVIHLLWRAPDSTLDGVADAVVRLGRVVDDLADTRGVTVWLEEPAAAEHRIGAAADGSLLTAAIAVWSDHVDVDAAPLGAAVSDVVASTAALCSHAGWLVTESVPRERLRGPAASPSPGLTQLTRLTHRPGIDPADFLDRWHRHQAPLAFDVHPIERYLRHGTVRPLAPHASAPRTDGIVMEAVATDDDMLDRHRFFGAAPGDDTTRDDNMSRMFRHTMEFLDLTAIEVVVCREHVLAPAPHEP